VFDVLELCQFLQSVFRRAAVVRTTLFSSKSFSLIFRFEVYLSSPLRCSEGLFVVNVEVVAEVVVVVVGIEVAEVVVVVAAGAPTERPFLASLLFILLQGSPRLHSYLGPP